MKKLILFSMIAVTAMGIIGCGEDDKTKADLMWRNSDNTSDVNTIQWISNGKADQTWEGTYAKSGGETTFKGIEELAGQGECFIGSSPAEIELDTTNSSGVVTGTISTNSAVIQENAAAVLVIQTATTAKK